MVTESTNTSGAMYVNINPSHVISPSLLTNFQERDELGHRDDEEEHVEEELELVVEDCRNK